MSKTEVLSFTPAGTPTTVLLNDPTLQVKGVHCQITKNSTTAQYNSTGFSDGTRHRALSSFSTSTKRESKRSTTASITHYEDVSGTTTKLLEGYPSNISTAGQIEFTFPTFSAIPIDIMVVGD